jgi:WD40 repeat protein
MEAATRGTPALLREPKKRQELTFSPDGKFLFGQHLCEVSVWRVSDGQFVRHLDRECRSLSVPAKGRVSCVSGDNLVYQYGLERLESLGRVQGPKHPANAFAVSPDGQFIVFSSSEGINLWRVNDQTMVQTFNGTDWNSHHVAFSPDGKVVAAVTDDQHLKLYRTDDGTLIRSLGGSNENPLGLSVSTDGQRLTAGYTDGNIHVWNIGSGAYERTVATGFKQLGSFTERSVGHRFQSNSALACRGRRVAEHHQHLIEISVVTCPLSGWKMACLRLVQQ